MRDMGRDNNVPFFIVGVHRSGTTLLRYMLSSHPHIYIPPESDFIPRFFLKDPTSQLSERRIRMLLNIIFTRYRFVWEWSGPPPDLETFLQSLTERTPAAFLDTLYRTYARQFGAERWGDKTPIYASYLDLLDRLFPQAQFIHILRDGRDVAVSMLEKWGRKDFHIDLYFAARNWVRRIHQVRQAGARLGPERFYELHYENLVREPETQLRPLCHFLGETYLPILAEPHRLGQAQIEPDSFHAAIRQPPSAKRVERWRQELRPADQRLFQYVAGELLEELGYPLVDLGPTSPTEILRISLLATKYVGLQSGRRVLQALGVFPPI